MSAAVDLFSCFWTSIINLAIRDDSNAIQQWIKCNCWPVTPYRLHHVTAGHENMHVNRSSQNRDRAVCEVSLCLSSQGTSTDMQQDLPGRFIMSGHLTRPKVKFSNWPFRVKIIWFDASWREGYDGDSRFSLSLLFQKLFAQTLIFRKKQHFMFDLPWEGQNVS